MGMLTGKYDDGIPADQAYEQKLRETNSVPAAQDTATTGRLGSSEIILAGRANAP